MTYDHQLELQRARLLRVVGTGGANLDMLALWDQYLTLLGITGGALLDRQKRAATAAGVSLMAYIQATADILGPELAPVVGSGAGYTLTGTTPPTHDGTGIHFVGSSGNDAATFAAGAGVIPNDVMMRIQYTTANRSGGTGRVLVYADTINHLASTSAAGCPGNVNGTCTAYRATSFTGGNLREIRIQCQTGLCTLDITSCSVRRVF